MMKYKKIPFILLLCILNVVTVAPMEQPVLPPNNLGWGQWVRNAYTSGAASVTSLYDKTADFGTQLTFYGFPGPDEDYDEVVNNSVVQPANKLNNPGNPQKPMGSQGPQGDGAPLPNSGNKKQTEPAEIPQSLDQNKSKNPSLRKKIIIASYTLGGSLLAAGAAVTYKAINYVRLTGVLSNVEALNMLIQAAQVENEARFKEIFNIQLIHLTLLEDTEKGLLKHLVTDKDKFVSAATQIKLELPERAKRSIWCRIGYGITHDIKTAQGCWGRARIALNNKLSKLFSKK